MREITEIVVHCTATDDQGRITVAKLRQMHLGRGFSDIGYHYVILRGGIIEQGRPIEEPGAHVEGHNLKSVGIALEGGVEADDKLRAEFNYDRAQMRALEFMIGELIKKFPTAAGGVKGHRDYPGVKKECPCFDVRSWWYVSEPIREGATS